jgi:hypothetical protein
MNDATAPNTELAYAETHGSVADALNVHIDATGYMLGGEFGVPRSVVRELIKAGVPAFGSRQWGAC